MTYDQWKTTDPRDYEPEEEEEPSELELVYRQLWDAIDDAKNLHEIAELRIKKLEASLEEALAYFVARYDVKDGDNGEQLPNEEMRLGGMIAETLNGIRF